MDPRMLNFITTSERADSLIILFQMKELRPFLTLSDATVLILGTEEDFGSGTD